MCVRPISRHPHLNSMVKDILIKVLKKIRAIDTLRIGLLPTYL